MYKFCPICRGTLVLIGISGSGGIYQCISYCKKTFCIKGKRED